MTRLPEYIDYHLRSAKARDIDPAYAALEYVCDRFELNVEQRYWLAFLYATCYAAPTVFYMYNEFPDYANVDFARMERWWSANRPKVLFQTDRRWVRSRNQFVPMCRSYAERLGGLTQQQKFLSLRAPTPEQTYDACYAEMGKIFQMGRFALFLYLEAVHVLTGYPMMPTGLDLANAESSRNGLAFAVGRDDLMTHGTARRLTKLELSSLHADFQGVYGLLRDLRDDVTVWNVETTLCAYKKHKLGKRWIGYYIERMRGEIEQMERAVTTGVDWSVLWDFRREYFDHQYLSELQGSEPRGGLV